MVEINDYLVYLTPLAPYLGNTAYKTQKGGAYTLDSLIGLLVSLYAAYLAWDCSKFETPAMRVFYTVVAFLFGGLYLIYYFVYRYLMAVKCY